MKWHGALTIVRLLLGRAGLGGICCQPDRAATGIHAIPLVFAGCAGTPRMEIMGLRVRALVECRKPVPARLAMLTEVLGSMSGSG